MTPRPERGAAESLKAGVEKEMAFLPELEGFLERALRALDQTVPEFADVHTSSRSSGSSATSSETSTGPGSRRRERGSSLGYFATRSPRSART